MSTSRRQVIPHMPNPAEPVPGHAPKRRTGRYRSATAAALGTAVLLLTSSPGVVAAMPSDTAATAEERAKEELRRQQATLAAQLDLPNASNEQVMAALMTLDQHVQAEMAKAVENQKALDDAKRRSAQAQAELTENQRKVDTLNNDLRDQAVQRYVNPEDNDSSMRLLTATNFDEAEQRKVLASVANGDSKDIIDRIREARTRNDELSRVYDAAQAEATAIEQAQAALIAQLRADGDAHKRTKDEWEKRLDALDNGHAKVNGADAELTRAIATQRSQAPAMAPAAGAGGGRFIWPINGQISRGFWGARSHAGMDIWSSAGAPIWAATGGTVKSAGYNSGGYGNLVVLEHGGGMQTYYAHLSRIDVRAGQSVARGQQVGVQGNTGNSRGAHLHFEVRLGGTPVNPAPYLP